MANKKYKLVNNDYWATDGVYDFGQSKTQRQINSDVATHLSGLDDDVSDLNGAINDKILYFTNLQLTLTYPNSDVILRIPSTGVLDEITTDSVVLDCYFNRPDGIESAITWQSYNGYIEFTGINDASTNATANVVIGKKKMT